MAPSVLSVTEMINDLRDAAYPVAEAELHQLQEYALAHGQTEPMEPRVELSKETMVLDHEVIKEYFPRAKVLEGMFELASQLFGIRVEPGDESVETWHPDVQFYQIRSMERPGEPVIAYFYMDPFARPGQKRIGSWTQLLVARSKVFGTPEMPIRLPVFSIVCNQIPPADDESPNLMPFDSILQLFRNFGHGLRVALNQAEYSFASNFDGVELEALEMTAVLWQYFCFDRGVIQMISSHYKTGAPLPDNLLESLVAARKYMAATDLLRQMRFAATDTALHHYYDPDSSESIRQIQLQIDERYKWAEMVTVDAFAMFDESKHEDWKVIGRKFRDTMLANLGIYHPMEAFQMFRGRPPRHEALLHIYGLK
ncbi:unnamed protein product [Aphanomyces euteiches]